MTLWERSLTRKIRQFETERYWSMEKQFPSPEYLRIPLCRMGMPQENGSHSTDLWMVARPLEHKTEGICLHPGHFRAMYLRKLQEGLGCSVLVTAQPVFSSYQEEAALSWSTWNWKCRCKQTLKALKIKSYRTTLTTRQDMGINTGWVHTHKTIRYSISRDRSSWFSRVPHSGVIAGFGT